MNQFFSLAALASVLIVVQVASPAEAASARVVYPNAQGGTTAGSLAARQGANGGAFARGRTVSTDGLGDATASSGAAVRGANGGTGVRAGFTTRAADGALQHQSGFAAQTSKGSLQSSGSATRGTDGQVAQSRTTVGTSAVTGNSIQSTSTYNTGSGRSRTTSCSNAAGASIACPTRP